MAAPTAVAQPGTARRTPARRPAEPTDAASHDAWPWVVGGLFAAGVGLVLVRALRPR